MKHLKNVCAIAFCLTMLFTGTTYAQWNIKVDSIFSEFTEGPGCAVGVFQNGEIIFQKGYGYANLDYDIPITPETVFDIGSVSKQFTAACIVILENEGKLSFDDDIRKHIPEIPSYEEGVITIRHLLNHTSGLRDYLTLMYLSGIDFNDSFNEQKGLEILKRQKGLNFVPGSEYLYSNSGYLALAIIVRRITGQSVGEYSEQKIFDPLGMDHSLVYEDGAITVKNRAIGYISEGDDFRRLHHWDFVLGGDGQVYTTVKDFFKWNENFRSNQLGDETFIDKLLTKGILNNGDTLDYALGISHGTYKGHHSIGHGGAWGGFRAHYLHFPKEDLGVVVMSNLGSVNASEKAHAIADLLLDDISVDSPVTNVMEENSEESLDEFPLDQFVGKYEVRPGVMAQFSVKEDSLQVLQMWNDATYTIVRTQGNSFQIPNDKSLLFTFSKLENGFTQELTVDQGGNKSVLNRVEVPDMTDINLDDYAGIYHSNELDVNYRMYIENDKLMVQIEIQDALELEVHKKDQFLVLGSLVRFVRTDDGISGFYLDAGRVNNLLFQKQAID